MFFLLKIKWKDNKKVTNLTDVSNFHANSLTNNPTNNPAPSKTELTHLWCNISLLDQTEITLIAYR